MKIKKENTMLSVQPFYFFFPIQKEGQGREKKKK